MNDYELLMIPGPTDLPGEVLEALGRPQISHRVGRFRDLVRRVSSGLQPVFGTGQLVLTLTASSTGAMEAAIVNLLSPGESVVAVDTGKFGERLGLIAEVYGAQVHWVRVSRGQAVTEEILEQACEQAQPRAVLLVQNETSTGVLQDVKALGQVGRRHGALVVVDAVSSLGGYPMEMDEWDLDAVIAGSQKALMLPPGLGFVALSERGWEAAETATMPRFYFDLNAARKNLEKGETPYTPNTNLFVALEEVLKLISGETLEARFARHHNLAVATRAGIEALGLELFAAEGQRSETVTAITSPVDSQELTKAVREKHGIIIAGGQSELRGKIFRIGHMGVCQLEQVLKTLAAVAEELAGMDFPCDGVLAVQAAKEAYG